MAVIIIKRILFLQSLITPLQEATLQIISESSCSSSNNGGLTDRMICAVYPKEAKENAR